MTFTDFYIETERLVTLARNRSGDILELYNVIISTIGSSLLSDSKGVKTWITESYLIGRFNSIIDSGNYYYKAVDFVKELQLLVLDRYDSVDDFYETEGVTVSQTFAFLSEAAGYPISPQYIEDIS